VSYIAAVFNLYVRAPADQIATVPLKAVGV
jgi:hypothetical protein